MTFVAQSKKAEPKKHHLISEYKKNVKDDEFSKKKNIPWRKLLHWCRNVSDLIG